MRDWHDWPYAVMTNAAASCGGPEAYEQILRAEGFSEGDSEGRARGSMEALAAMSVILLVAKVGPKAVEWARGKVAKLRGRAAAAERDVPDEADRTTPEG